MQVIVESKSMSEDLKNENNANDSEIKAFNEFADEHLESKEAAPVQQVTSIDEERLEENFKKTKDGVTRSILFSIGSFMVSLYAVYEIGAMKSQQTEILSEVKQSIMAIGPLSVKQQNEVAFDNRNIYPTDPRVMSIASTLLIRGVSLEESRGYIEEVADEVVLDSTEQYFFKTMAAYGSPLTMVNRSGPKQITLFDKWKINFDSEDAYLLEQFPMNPTLVMNHESVAFPECVEGAEPFVAYAKATTEGEEWVGEPSVLRDDKLGRWIFTFGDIEPLDTAAFNRRVLAVPNCRLVDDSEKSE